MRGEAAVEKRIDIIDASIDLIDRMMPNIRPHWRGASDVRYVN
jgi:hypothetical protein